MKKIIVLTLMFLLLTSCYKASKDYQYMYYEEVSSNIVKDFDYLCNNRSIIYRGNYNENESTWLEEWENYEKYYDNIVSKFTRYNLGFSSMPSTCRFKDAWYNELLYFNLYEKLNKDIYSSGESELLNCIIEGFDDLNKNQNDSNYSNSMFEGLHNIEKKDYPEERKQYFDNKIINFNKCLEINGD